MMSLPPSGVWDDQDGVIKASLFRQSTSGTHDQHINKSVNPTASTSGLECHGNISVVLTSFLVQLTALDKQ